jgi:hypothetical protein
MKGVLWSALFLLMATSEPKAQETATAVPAFEPYSSREFLLTASIIAFGLR